MAKITEIADIPSLERQKDQIIQMLRSLNNEIATTGAAMSNSLGGVKTAKGANELTSIIEKQNKQVDLLNKKYEELQKTEGDLYQSTAKLAEAKAKVRIETDKVNKAANQEQKEAAGMVSAYDKLNEQYKEATARAKALGVEHGRNSKEYRTARDEANRYGQQLRAIDADLGNHQRNVGNYTSAFKNFGTQILAFAGITAGLAGAMKLVNTVMQSTNELGDRFAKTLSGAKEATSFLARGIATLDFTNLIQGFKDTYREGRRYAEQLDFIQDLQRSAGLQKEDIDIQITRLKTEAKLNTTSLEDKKRYVDQIAALEKRKLDISLQVANQAAENELLNASKITGVQKSVIENFVGYYGSYNKMLDEGRKIDERLRKESTALITTLDARGRAVQELGFSQQAYNENLKKLSAEDRARIDLLKVENVLTDEKRDKIATTLLTQKQAYREQADGENSLVRIKNKLNKELFTEQTLVKDNTSAWKEWGDELNNRMATVPQDTAASLLGLDPEIAKAKRKEVQQVLDTMTLRPEQVFPLPDDKLSQEWEDFYDSLQDLAIETLGTGISDQISASFENSINEMNAQLEEWHAKELENLETRKEQGLINDQQYQQGREAIEKQYEAKRKAARIREAQIKKQEALWEIAINTAVAFTKSLTKDPTGILGLYDLAQGAAQAALVAAQPLPKYAKGRKGGPGEFAIVGDAGQEAIRLKSGETYMTPNTATMTYLPSGADVISNKELRRSIDVNMDAENYRQYTREVVNAINSKREVYVNLDSNGLRTFVKNGNRLQKYLDRAVRL